MAQKKELFKPGQRITGTMLTVIEEAQPRGTTRYFLCQCDCGSEPKEISYNSLKYGATKSCGCLHKEAVSKPLKPQHLLNRRKQKFKRAMLKNNTTGIKGVSYIKSKQKYKAAIVINGKQIYGGVYDTLLEAAKARKKLEDEYISNSLIDPFIGTVFGSWEVMKLTDDKPYYYDCKCKKCGKIYSVAKTSLVNKKSTMCRLCANKIKENRKIYTEIIGKTFGKLTVTGWSIDEKSGRTVYTCDCQCGNTTTAQYNELVTHKKKQSCGCLRKELNRESIKNTYEAKREIHQKASIDGSSAFHLNERVSKNSTTGIKGVSETKNGRYRAYIVVARKQIYLGTFGTLEEAAAARKQAEERYFKPILDKYNEQK